MCNFIWEEAAEEPSQEAKLTRGGTVDPWKERGQQVSFLSPWELTALEAQVSHVIPAAKTNALFPLTEIIKLEHIKKLK